MMLKDYIKEVLDHFKKEPYLSLDLEITVNHNLVVDDDGKQKITLHIRQ